MYDVGYFYKMLKDYAPTAADICRRRWEFVSGSMPTAPLGQGKLVLDYGCGCGFFKAFAPAWADVDTFDIMPVPQTGIKRERYDLLTLWDVIEHFDWGNFERDLTIPLEPIFDRVDAVALTVPILPSNKGFAHWKHRKPKEHLTVFTVDSLKWFMDLRGFILSDIGTPECPPRVDITSFLFTRVAPMKAQRSDATQASITTRALEAVHA